MLRTFIFEVVSQIFNLMIVLINDNYRFKVLNALLEMEGRPSVSHPLSTYIETTKEKNGMIKTKLKIPFWNRQEPQPPVDLSDEDICIIGSTTVGLTNGLNDTRGTADGGFTEITTPGK